MIEQFAIRSVGTTSAGAINFSAGTTSNNLSAITFSNSNGISFGLNGSVITASGGGGGGSFNVSAGTTSSNISAITFSNGSGVSFGFDGSNITATVKTNYLTTAMASNRGSDFVQATAVFHGTNASGTIDSGNISVSVAAPSNNSINISAGTTSSNVTAVTFSNANGVSFGFDGTNISATVQTNYITTAMASNRGSDFVQATAVFNGTNASGTIASNAISVSVNTSLTAIKVSAGASSSNVSAITFSNSNGVSFGYDGTNVTATVKTNYAGTGTSATNASITLNTDGLAISVAAGSNSSWTVSDAVTSMTIARLAFTNANGLTLSLSTTTGGSATVVGSYTVPTQTVQTQNCVDLSLSGNTSGTLALISSGTAILAGGNNITLSQNGQSVTISAFNQSVQTQNLIDVTLAGNTSGTLALVSSGTLTLAGGNNITISQNGNAVTISGPNTAAQTVQTQNCVDLSASGNTSGTLALISSGTAILAGGNNITLSQNGQSITISAFNQSVQTQNNVDLSLSGNTSGTLTLISSGTAILAGGNNITLSQNGQSVTISAFNQSVQTQNCVDLSLSGNTSGTLALVSSGTGILAGGNNITLSQNGQSITISGPNTAAQTVQTQNCVDISLSGNTSGTLALISSGTGILAGGNNITLSQNGQSVTISAFNQSVQTQNNVDLSLAGNTSGTLTLISSGTAILAGGNNITLSQNGQSVTISAFNQSVQTQNCVDVTLGGNTSGTLTLISSGTMFLAGGNNITLSQNGQSVTISAGSAAAAPVQFSAGTTSQNLATLKFVDSNGISFGLGSGASSQSLTATVATNYAGTGFTTSSQAGKNISATLDTNGLSMLVPGYVTLGVAISNSQTVFSSGTVALSEGGGAITIASSAGGQSLKFSVPQTSSIVGVNGISISTNGSTISVSQNILLSYFENMPLLDAASTTLSASGSVLQVLPFYLPAPISIGWIRFPVSMSYVSTEVSGTTANSTWTVNRSYTDAVAIMSQGIVASSLTLVYSTSSSATWVFQNQIGAGAQGSRYTVTQNVSYPISGTTSNYTTSYAQSSANVQISSASMTLFTGPRWLDVPFAVSLSAGNYWMVLGRSTNSATQAGNSALGGASAGFSYIGASQNNLSVGFPGAATNSSIQLQPGLGSWSTNAAVMSTSSIAIASVSAMSSGPKPYFQMIRYA